jgi:hypothetical protein
VRNLDAWLTVVVQDTFGLGERLSFTLPVAVRQAPDIHEVYPAPGRAQ